MEVEAYAKSGGAPRPPSEDAKLLRRMASAEAEGDLCIEARRKKPIAWYEDMAMRGDYHAQFHLGKYYSNVDVNYSKAILYYSLAAEQGFAKAQYNLAKIYAHGHGNLTAADSLNESIKWYTRAGAQGFANAYYNLGIVHIKNFQDYDAAEKCFRKAADTGVAKAQFNLGWIHLRLHHNTKEAITWLSKAAEQGHEVAQTSLAKIYRNGDGVPVDLPKAIRLYATAAESGVSKAQLALACIFLTEKDHACPNAAVYHLIRALESGEQCAHLLKNTIHNGSLTFNPRYYSYYQGYAKEAIKTLMTLHLYQAGQPAFPGTSIHALPIELLFMIFGFLVIRRPSDGVSLQAEKKKNTASRTKKKKRGDARECAIL